MFIIKPDSIKSTINCSYFYFSNYLLAYNLNIFFNKMWQNIFYIT